MASPGSNTRLAARAIASGVFAMTALAAGIRAQETVTLDQLKSSGSLVGSDVMVEGYYHFETVPLLLADPELALINSPFREKDFVRLQGELPPREWHGARLRIPGTAVVGPDTPLPGDLEGPGGAQSMALEVRRFERLSDFELAPPAEPAGSAGLPRPAIKSAGANVITPNAVALLYSGGVNAANNHARYWNDLTFMYLMLQSYGYTDENIVLSYAGGTAPEGVTSDWIDYDGTGSGLRAAFRELGGLIDPETGVFIFTTNHGGGFDPGDPSASSGGPFRSRLDSNGDEGTEPLYERSYGVDFNNDGDQLDRIAFDEVLWLWGGAPMYDEDFASLVDALPECGRMTILMGQSFSGGLIRDLSAPNRVVISAASQVQPSWSSPDGRFNEFCYHFTSALARRDWDGNVVGADADLDGRISMLEAFNHAVGEDAADETPYYDDTGDEVSHPGPLPSGGEGYLGSLTYVDHADPVSIIGSTNWLDDFAIADRADLAAGHSALVQGRYDEATRYLTAAAAQNPMDAGVWRDLATAHASAHAAADVSAEPPYLSTAVAPGLQNDARSTGRHLADATSAIEHAAALDGSSAATFALMGTIWAMRGDDASASAALEHARSLDAARPEVSNDLGVLAFRDGRLALAEQLFERADRYAGGRDSRYAFNMAFTKVARFPDRDEEIAREFLASHPGAAFADWFWSETLKSTPPTSNAGAPESALGGITLGHDVGDVIGAVGWTEDMGSTSDGEWDWYHFTPAGLTLFVVQKGDRRGQIWSVRTFAPNTSASAGGISVGSTVSAITSTYGSPQQTRALNDERLYEYPSRGITFHTAGDEVTGVEIFPAH